MRFLYLAGCCHITVMLHCETFHAAFAHEVEEVLWRTVFIEICPPDCALFALAVLFLVSALGLALLFRVLVRHKKATSKIMEGGSVFVYL